MSTETAKISVTGMKKSFDRKVVLDGLDVEVAQGVGLATTNAVVYASVLILFFDYFLTELFLTQ